MSRETVAKNVAANGALIQLVTFHLGDEEYAVEVLKVREIIRMTSITHVPNTPASVLGIVNLRGKVIPIVSLRERFNMGWAEHSQHTRIMVTDVAGTLMGFVVDGVSEVIRVSAAEIQPAPNLVKSDVDHEVISGVIKHGEHLLIMLQLDRIFTDGEQRALEFL